LPPCLFVLKPLLMRLYPFLSPAISNDCFFPFADFADFFKE
jgi:hypothetical protein